MQETQGMRERLFTMRMSDEESARLDRVAKHHALNAASAIRMLVKREDDRLAQEEAAQALAPGRKSRGRKR